MKPKGLFRIEAEGDLSIEHIPEAEILIMLQAEILLIASCLLVYHALVAASPLLHTHSRLTGLYQTPKQLAI